MIVSEHVYLQKKHVPATPGHGYGFWHGSQKGNPYPYPSGTRTLTRAGYPYPCSALVLVEFTEAEFDIGLCQNEIRVYENEIGLIKFK